MKQDISGGKKYKSVFVSESIDVLLKMAGPEDCCCFIH